jgi:hypothetical protein
MMGWATTVSTKAKKMGPRIRAPAWMPQTAPAVPATPSTTVSHSGRTRPTSGSCMPPTMGVRGRSGVTSAG